jgi:hypothetical protein
MKRRAGVGLLVAALLTMPGCASTPIAGYRPEAPETLIGEWTGSWTHVNYPGWNGPLAVIVTSITKSQSGEEWLAHGRIERSGNDQTRGTRLSSFSFRNGQLTGTTLVLSGRTWRYTMTVDGLYMRGTEAMTSHTATLSLAKTKDTLAEAKARAVVVMRKGYLRMWIGNITCSALEEYDGFTFPVEVSATGDGFTVTRGVADQPGFFTLGGVPEANGRLELIGNGIAAVPKYRGNPYSAEFNGRFEGDRYQAPGRLGARKCVISISPAQ